jgi:hypothetical protein
MHILAYFSCIQIGLETLQKFYDRGGSYEDLVSKEF